MNICGDEFPTLEVFKSMMTVPDCIVRGSNKLGQGHGEAKFYIASKNEMRAFYGREGFQAKCIMLKKDLIAYMDAIKNEYMNPSQEYAKKEDLPRLWQERMDKILSLPDVIEFTINDQIQIEGERGYINSSDAGYCLIREIALPLVSYVYAEKIGEKDKPVFYWKLFVDFDAIWEKKNGPLVFNYGKPKEVIDRKEDREQEKQKEIIRQSRNGQGKYREGLLEQCHFCPITMISEERILIASHIKPWAASTDDEKIDPYNGYLLSPLYDKLFDRGFITFTNDRHMIISEVVSPYNWKLMGIKNDTLIQALPMDERRQHYLEFHRQSVFKGNFS